jgi:16S rRNA (guanine966-N2)-methyltransferase
MKHQGKASQLRIIGGQWRGRRLSFRVAQGLRPTTDRVRETLFNWLQGVIHDARCVDLFAGSGALGLEALSRGAASCDFVDASSAATSQIAAHLDTLGALERGHCHTLSAQSFLTGAQRSYDLVFIDPPFGSALVEPSCALLAAGGLVAPGARVYIEMGTNEPAPLVPADWTLLRDKTAGGVAYRLFVVGPG